MSEKIEFEVTPQMGQAAWRYGIGDLAPDPVYAFKAIVATEDFQSQLRAYVAGEMRKVVPEMQLSDEYDGDEERARKRRHNACVTTTLANIAAYEKEQEDGNV